VICDLVGSTALSTRFDPEDLREVIGAYHRAVAEIVAGFDGFAAVACNALLDRAFGKPREHPPQPSPVSELSDAELDEALVGYLVDLGLSERKARALLKNSPSRVGIIPRRSSK
jgi:class 3 adenylate cyclase